MNGVSRLALAYLATHYFFFPAVAGRRPPGLERRGFEHGLRLASDDKGDEMETEENICPRQQESSARGFQQLLFPL